MKTMTRLACALMLGVAFSATALAQMVTPLLPPEAQARPRTPEQQAMLDIQTRELMREMALLNINALRPARNAVNPTGPYFANYEERLANPYPALPDLLAFKNGKSVRTRADWLKRRAEIKALFDSEVYGKYPAVIPKVSWKVEGVDSLTIEGVPVIAKRIVGTVDNSAYPAISIEMRLDVVTPAAARGRRVPVIIGGGTVPRQNLNGPAPGAAPLPGRGAPNPRIVGPATDSSAKQLLDKGWGFAALNTNQVQADNAAGLTAGIIGLVNKGQPRKLDDWGVLRAWAWAQSRAMDYLVTDRDVDRNKVGVFGHSRGGKAALIALVDDPRFAIGFISSSGAGGANLYRRNYGELSENLCAPNEFHWMAGNFLKYCAVGHTIDELPVDSHQFIALAAPRSIFIGGGDLIMDPGLIPGDAWQDAKGMFMAGAAASPAWEFYGLKGLPATMPPKETALVAGSVGFRQHLYGHVPGPNWSHFIAFAAKEFDRRK
jgi:hypothetical protein